MADENTGATPGAPENVAPATPGITPGGTGSTPQTVADAVQQAPAGVPAAEAAAAAGLVTPPAAQVTVLESTAGDDGKIEFEPTGDPALDVALDYLGSLGFAGDNAAMQKAAAGDFSMLEAQLAVMGDKAKGHERMLALAKDAYARSETQRVEAHKATESAITSVVGSKENWAAIVEWAGKNADPAEKEAINKMIDGGPVQARAAANLLQSAYQAAQGTKVVPAPAVRDAAGGAVISNGPLDQRSYAAAVRELSQKLGNRMETSQEYADLQRRLR